MLVDLQAGKAAPRRAGRGDGKAGPPKHETSMTGDGGNGSPASGDAAPAEDSASGAQQPAPKTEDSSARRGDAAACSAGGGAGPQSASKSAVPDAAPHPSSACVSGACAVLNGPAGLASAAGLDVSDRSGREPAAAHAASTTPATQPGHDQRQRWGSDAALTSVPGSRQVIPAVSRSEAPASGGKRTASKLAPSSTGDTQASGAVPVWTQPDAEPQNATPGERSTAPVSTALVRATPASKKAVIVHNPSAEAGRTQLPPPPQQRRNADGMEGRPTTADAAPSESPSENGNKSRSNGTASQQPDSTSLEVGSDGPAESQQGGAHADGDDGGQADGQAAKCSGLPYTWSQASTAALKLHISMPERVHPAAAFGAVSTCRHVRTLSGTTSRACLTLQSPPCEPAYISRSILCRQQSKYFYGKGSQ